MYARPARPLSRFSFEVVLRRAVLFFFVLKPGLGAQFQRGGAEGLAKYANKEGVYTCIGFQLSRDEIYAWFKHTEDEVKLCLPTINTTATSTLSKRLSSYHGKSLKYGQPTHESELLTLSQLTAA